MSEEFKALNAFWAVQDRSEACPQLMQKLASSMMRRRRGASLSDVGQFVDEALRYLESLKAAARGLQAAKHDAAAYIWRIDEAISTIGNLGALPEASVLQNRAIELAESRSACARMLKCFRRIAKSQDQLYAVMRPGSYNELGLPIEKFTKIKSEAEAGTDMVVSLPRLMVEVEGTGAALLKCIDVERLLMDLMVAVQRMHKLVVKVVLPAVKTALKASDAQEDAEDAMFFVESTIKAAQAGPLVIVINPNADEDAGFQPVALLPQP
ncbi:hypothetical protein HYH02_014650 [Chlamydomonas schloesseri]|uniref:Uncharacterized protein n=1 Tax=Chlamydomonas schloesseri TaxID=2026947 RepID=A0A835VV48_9CHLO|nr:hypothetical protein HYH02_014650 [Chlamydomonas schloesseri]|eukprot:KAG2427003.1 hypothetical protein HYH02_014650 [Chlamydomonas schloesseri]